MEKIIIEEMNIIIQDSMTVSEHKLSNYWFISDNHFWNGTEKIDGSYHFRCGFSTDLETSDLLDVELTFENIDSSNLELIESEFMVQSNFWFKDIENSPEILKQNCTSLKISSLGYTRIINSLDSINNIIDYQVIDLDGGRVLEMYMEINCVLTKTVDLPDSIALVNTRLFYRTF